MTKVSVIVPVFNGEATLKRALDSLLAQTMQDFEAILVDDGSTDGTSGIISAYVKKDVDRFRSVNLTINQGVSHARNAALEAATGAWIAVLDADDSWEPTRLETLISLQHKLNADILLDELLLFNPLTDKVEGQSRFSAGLEARKIAATDLFEEDTPYKRVALGYAHPLFRASFLRAQKIRYDETLRQGEDFLLLAECLLAGAQVFAVPYAGYIYSFRPLFVSEKDKSDLGASKYSDVLKANDYLVSRYGSGMPPQAKRALLYRRSLFQELAYARKIRQSFGAQKKGEAVRLLIKRPSVWPFLVKMSALGLIRPKRPKAS